MSIKKEAKNYIELGLPIIPLCSHTHEFVSPKHKSMCPCAGKMPLIKDWQTREITSLDNLIEWEEQFREFNIGLPLGSASGFCGIDVDGEQGEAALLEMSGGNLPETWEYKTGQGRRLLYAIPEGIKTKKVKQTGEGVHQECALMCDGQQTVIPPSIHINGTMYEWMTDKDPESIDCAQAPKWLLDLIRVPTSGAYQLGGSGANRSVSSALVVNQAEQIAFAVVDETDFALPREINLNPDAAARGKTGAKVPIREILQLLDRPIEEGSRDDTITKIIGHFCAKPELRAEGAEAMFTRCREYNLKWCDPPLSEQEIDAKVNKFWAAEEAKSAQYSKEEKPPFLPKEWAKGILEHLQSVGELYEYCDATKSWYCTSTSVGPWQDLGHYKENLHMFNLISSYVTDPSFGGFAAWGKTGNYREVCEHMRMLFIKEGVEGNFDLAAPENENINEVIVFRNAVLRWEDKEIINWDPAYRTTIGFDIDYDPMARCPNFENYMKMWLNEDDLIMLVQEYVGTLLLPEYKQKAFLWLYGETNCGKTTFVNILLRIFGKHASAMSWEEIGDRFMKYELKNKLCNIHDDTDGNFKKDVNFIKNITSGGTFTAEQKGKDPVKFRNTAKPIFASNHLPKTQEKSDAFYGRLKLIHFANQFKFDALIGEEIARNVELEIPGIINWMIEGLRRFKRNGQLTVASRAEKNLQELKEDNDDILMLSKRVFRKAPRDNGKEVQLRPKDAYDFYIAWCDEMGVAHKKKQKTFINDLVAAYNDKTICVNTAKRPDTLRGKNGLQIKNLMFTEEALEEYEDIFDQLNLKNAIKEYIKRNKPREVEFVLPK